MPNQENNYNFARVPCAQQPQSNQQYGPYPFSNNSYNSQSTPNMYDIMYGAQSRNQVTHPQSTPNIYDHIDPSWLTDSRTVSELKFPDKIETIEISSKDLSPASCCSNIDLLLPDFYKNVSNKVSDTQLYNSLYNTTYNKNYIEYPSCSQINCEETNFEKTVKYCSIQKSNYFENTIKNYETSDKHYELMNKNYDISNRNYDNMTNKNYEIQNKHFGLVNKNFNYNNDVLCNQYNIQTDMFNQFENKIQDNSLINITDVFPPTQEICAGLPYDTLTLDQRTEGTNDDSDIIVEESDDEETIDYCEDTERRYDYTTNCMVCDSVYSPSGNQFYILTSETPLTMSSQKPVYKKLVDLVGLISIKRNYLCSQCLSLINTIDHLQFKLDNCKFDLSTKYEKTNNIGGNTMKLRDVKKKYAKCKHKFNCRLCKKVFSIQNLYKSHIARHRSLNRFLCDVCGQRFTKIASFKMHLKVHCVGGKLRIVKIKAFLCKICKKPFRTQSNLKEHENYCSGKLPFKCKSCNKKFATSTKLKNHVKLKHDKKFTSICSICNIGFIQLSNYKAHMITHSTDKKFNCTKCEKSYKTSTNLKFHMKYHKDKLPFICSICTKGFMRKEYLEAHINLHKGLKNFACTVCDKKFIAQKNLDAHMKHHDGSIKKKSCNICGKLISTGLEDHLRTHTNFKEFECEKCDMRFNTKGAFFKHKKRKHDENNIVKLCDK